MMKKVMLFFSFMPIFSATMGNAKPYGYKDMLKESPLLTVASCAIAYPLLGSWSLITEKISAPKTMINKVSWAVMETSMAHIFSLAEIMVEIGEGLKTGKILKATKSAALKSGPAVVGFGVIPAIVYQGITRTSDTVEQQPTSNSFPIEQYWIQRESGFRDMGNRR